MEIQPALQALREGRLAIPLSPRALWKFTGTDRVRYLNGQVTHDVAKLTPGRALHAVVCNAKGKMDGEVWIHADAEALWVDAPAELRETLGTRLERYIIADDVTMVDATRIKTGYHLLAPPVGIPGVVVDSERFGVAGWDVWVEPDAVADIPPNAAADTVEAFRILQGIPLWGTDFTTDHLPPEAGLERDAVSYSKGCYIGQEVIARIKSRGHVNKRIVRVRGSGPVPQPLPQGIFDGERECGSLTSTCPDVEGMGWVGLGMLARTTIEKNSPLRVGDATAAIRDDAAPTGSHPGS